MTADEFLSWDSGDRSGRLWQLVDGEPEAMVPGSQNHAALQGEIGRQIANHLLDARPGSRLLVAPGVVPHLRANSNFRVADLGVTCAPPAADQMTIDPVLLFEILSPSNEAETWRNVWAYITIPTVAEILVVRSNRVEAELLRRLPDGNLPKQPEMLGPGDTLMLTSIGLTVALDALYATTSLRA